MGIAFQDPARCGATKVELPFQKGRTVMGLFEALLAVGVLMAAYLLLFTAAR